MRFLAPARFRAFVRLRSWALLTLLSLAFPATLPAQLPSARLTSIFPAGAQAGTKVEVTITGIDLDDVDRLWFSDSRITATQKMTPPGEFEPEPNPVPNTFEVTIPADIPVGAVECRAIGRFGVTNPRFFAISRRSELKEPGGNNKPAAAADLPLESIINGRLEPSSVDYYRVHLVAGQSIVIESWAGRIDSRADLYLTVYAPDGREFARARMAEGRDPVLSLTASQEGAYVIGVRDLVYGGGPEFVYRLSAHSRPVALVVNPPVVQAGKRSTIEVLGFQLPGGTPAEFPGAPQGLMRADLQVRVPIDAASRRDLIVGPMAEARAAWVDAVAYHPGGAWSECDPIGVLVTPLPVLQTTKGDPNGGIPLLTAPCEAAGLFETDRDEDAYEFDAVAGKEYRIDVQSHRLGWATDPALVLQRVTKGEDGKEQLQELSRFDDPPEANRRRQVAVDLSSDDPAIDFRPQEAMRVRVRVINQYADRAWRLPRPYRLRIEEKSPDFRAVVHPLVLGLQPNQSSAAANFLPRGGTATAQVVVERLHGMQGDIQVRAEGLPAGVHCQEIIIGEGRTTGVMTLIASQDAPASVSRIRFIASAEIDGVICQREARYVAITRGTDNRDADSGAVRLANDYVIAVSDRFGLPAAGLMSPAPVIETSLGARLEIPLRVARVGEFKEGIQFSVIGLPPPVKPEGGALAGDQVEGKVIAPLNVPNTRPGTYAVTLRGETKTAFSRNPDAVARAEARQAAVQKKVEEVAEAQKAAAGALEKANAELAEGQKLVEEAKAQVVMMMEMLARAEAEVKAKQEALEQAMKAQEEAKAAAETAAALAKEREEKLAALDAAQKAADAAVKAAQEKVQRAQQFKQAVDKQTTDIKNANAPKEMAFAVMTSPTIVRIHPSPIFFEMLSEQVSAATGGQAEIPLKISRKFGFDGDVEATLEFPSGVKGLAAEKIVLGKDVVDGVLICKVAADAPEGAHAATLKLKAKFNNLDVASERTVTIRVAKAAQ